jgi:hypothetical protein
MEDPFTGKALLSNSRAVWIVSPCSWPLPLLKI